jgi:hypothetical protein
LHRRGALQQRSRQADAGCPGRDDHRLDQADGERKGAEPLPQRCRRVLAKAVRARRQRQADSLAKPAAEDILVNRLTADIQSLYSVGALV